MTATDQTLSIELKFSRELTELADFQALATSAFERELNDAIQARR